jgi:2-(1,2-epoxy-1,2-dihydrophenyl)acetyl-CoA isomerase
MSKPDILYDVQGGLATLRINRPEARNSLIDGVGLQVYEQLLAASEDKAVRVLVLRGEGRDFCCGADIKGYYAKPDNGREPFEDRRRQFEVPVLLHDMPAVTVAAIRGGCAGAGLGWAAACDIRIAAASAQFNTAFLAVGAAGDMGGPWFLSRLVGAGRARDLYFFPRKFGAEEALAMGFVSRVVPDAEFEAELASLTERLTAAAPLALRAMKANFNAAERLDHKAYIALETERHAELFASRDRAEAFAAYVEKRPPKFEGR